MTESPEESHEAKFRIGAVSRLTRIPADTLRVWERRYAVVEPQRSEGGGRLYTQEDINRLDKIKRLVEAGHAIGTVANLSMSELNDRLIKASNTILSSETSDECRLVVIGETLTHKFSTDFTPRQNMELIGSFNTRKDYEKTSFDQAPNTIILEYPTLHTETARELQHLSRESNAKHYILVYGFGSQSVINQLEQAGITLLKSPVSTTELLRACFEHLRLSATQNTANLPGTAQTQQQLPPRLYNREQLARFASISTAVKCECPQHLADIILNLDSFEIYSLECENSNAEDAALHAYLHQATAKARSIMEDALKRVAEAEGLDEQIIS